MMPTPDPDRIERVESPSQCRDCHADLADAARSVDGWAQVWDVLPAVPEKVHYRLLTGLHLPCTPTHAALNAVWTS